MTQLLPDAVLHIRQTPLPRSQREGLRALGVEVAHLNPLDLDVALVADQEKAAMVRRLQAAEVCILDEGTGIRLAMAVVSFRREGQGRTLTTSPVVFEAVNGMVLAQDFLGDPQMVCEHIEKEDLLRTLRELGGRAPDAPVAKAGAYGHIRPPFPLPFVADPAVYTLRELHAMSDPSCLHILVGEGRLPPRVLLEPGASAAIHRNVTAIDILKLLIRHLPTEDLRLLRSDEARAWWARVAAWDIPGEGPVWDEPNRIQLEALVWDGLARDGGVDTLALLPPRIQPMREATQGYWGRAVRDIEAKLPLELLNAAVGEEGRSVGAWTLKQWGVVPCEDPLAAAADPHLFQPTGTTLYMARRYRPAPDVILGAYERWGGRPYLEKTTARQMAEFVKNSRPTTAAELEGWIRLLATLPQGRLRARVEHGMLQWPRLEMALVTLLSPETEWDQAMRQRLACLTASCELHETVMATVPPETLGHIGGTLLDRQIRHASRVQ